MRVLLFISTILINNIIYILASKGDSLPEYHFCMNKCLDNQCDYDINGWQYRNAENNPHLLSWTCLNECKYDCMWTTLEIIENRKQIIPQFHGKWPFIRFFGIQEPASTAFSILNFAMHVKMLMKFRKEVPLDSPLYWLWHIFCFVSLHAWFWSAIFHARDLPLTEFMDYAGAFSIVLITCYTMVIRIFVQFHRIFLLAVTAFFFALYMSHISYLYNSFRIDYVYNMQINLLAGTFTAFTWFFWCIWNQKRQPYVWRCAVFVALTGLVTLLELIDRPPLFYIFDSHSLWHLSTAFIIPLLYRFAINDCQYLRKMKKLK